MSFLRWFGKRETAPETTLSKPSDLGAADATVPLQHAAPDKVSQNSSRKSERVQRRELLYSIVRECMTAAGLLSSTYKFKVLSLDSGGREYLIMMDLPREYLSDPERFVSMEGAIARSAKERFDMLVTAVYWRVNDMVSARVPLQPAMHKATAPKASDKPPSSADTAARPTPTPATAEDVLAEEVLAFKRAVAAAGSGAAPVRLGEVIRSGRRNPAPQPDFSDTEPFDPNSPLGPSQFGGLN